MSRAQDPGMIEKVLEAEHIKKHKKTDFLLPKDMRMQEVRDWASKEIARARQKRIERTDGRTHKEKWVIPPDNYGAIAQQAGETYFPLARRIYEIILNFGRLTIDEIPKEFGAIEDKAVVILVNKMVADNYLRHYIETSKEEKGLLTLELVEQKHRRLGKAERLGMLTAKSTKSEDDEDHEKAKKVEKKKKKRAQQKSAPEESLD